MSNNGPPNTPPPPLPQRSASQIRSNSQTRNNNNQNRSNSQNRGNSQNSNNGQNMNSNNQNGNNGNFNGNGRGRGRRNRSVSARRNQNGNQNQQNQNQNQQRGRNRVRLNPNSYKVLDQQTIRSLSNPRSGNNSRNSSTSRQVSEGPKPLYIKSGDKDKLTETKLNTIFYLGENAHTVSQLLDSGYTAVCGVPKSADFVGRILGFINENTNAYYRVKFNSRRLHLFDRNKPAPTIIKTPFNLPTTQTKYFSSNRFYRRTEGDNDTTPLFCFTLHVQSNETFDTGGLQKHTHPRINEYLHMIGEYFINLSQDTSASVINNYEPINEQFTTLAGLTRKTRVNHPTTSKSTPQS